MQRTLFDKLFVGIQFTLFFLFPIPLGYFSLIPAWATYVGLAVAILGGIIVTLSLIQLNKNLTVFPTPLDDAQLVTSGLYAWVRHPIYSGILILVFGYSIFAESWYKLAISMALLILFCFKTSYEEKRLTKKYSNYEEYKKTHGRFLPKLF